MPNWCENHIVISHKNPEMIERVYKAAQDGELLNALRPAPNGVWNYDWCVNNWGTKWEVQSHIERKSSHTVSLWFDSAWSPPIEACEYAEKEFGYSIRLQYIEPGMCFAGQYKNGVNTYLPFPMHPADRKKCLKQYPNSMIKNLGILEMFGFMFDEEESYD